MVKPRAKETGTPEGGVVQEIMEENATEEIDKVKYIFFEKIFKN